MPSLPLAGCTDPGAPEVPLDSRTILASEPSPAPEELGHMLALTRIASQMVHGGTATLSAATTPRIAVQLHAQQFAYRYRQSKGPAHVVPGQTLRGSLGPAAQGHRTGFMHYCNSLSPCEVTAMLRALPKEHEVAEETLLLPVGSALWALHAAAALRSSSAPPVSPQQMSAHVPTLVLPLAKEWSAKGPLARLWSRFKAEVSPLQRCIEAESELPEGLGPWLQQRGVDVKCLESALRALKPCLVQGQDGPVRSVLQGHVRLSRTEHAAIQACFGKEGGMAGAPQHCLEQTDCHARWLCMACGRCAVYWVQRAVLGSGKSVRLAHLASATTELRAVLAMVERTAPPSGMPISLLPGGVPTSTSCLGAGGCSLLSAALPGAGHDFASLRGRSSAFHSYTAQTMGGVSDDSDVEA